MSLDLARLKILKAISTGAPDEEKIAEVVDMPTNVVEDYMQLLSQEGYLAIYLGNEFQLTSKGRIAVANPSFLPTNRQENNNYTTINAPNANIGFIQSGTGAISNFSQSIEKNKDNITTLIATLHSLIQHFPPEQKEEAEAELIDLEEDIKVIEKQNPKRFGRRLRRLFAIGSATTIASGTATFSGNVNDFTSNILELTEKLGVPSELVCPKTSP